jgi:hypothetical protein
MASSPLSLTSPFYFTKPHQKISLFKHNSLILNTKPKTLHHVSPIFRHSLAKIAHTHIKVSSKECLDAIDEPERLIFSNGKPVKFAFWVIFWASMSLAWFAYSKDANAAVDSIKASGFGLKIANSLRKLGWPDWVVVFTLATLPVLELRGAIPVGYWLQLNPATLTVLSILGLVSSSFLNPFFERENDLLLTYVIHHTIIDYFFHFC